MDFNSLGANAPIYVLNKEEGKRPVLQIGVVKTKSEPKSPYQVQQPAIFNGLAAMHGQSLVVDVVITVNGSDVPFNNLPLNAESTTYNGGNTFVSCSREAALQAVDSMMQAAKKGKSLESYYDMVLEEGEKMLETLNPRYKEEKDRDRSIRSLEARQDKTDKKLDSILEKLEQMFVPEKKESAKTERL